MHAMAEPSRPTRGRELPNSSAANRRASQEFSYAPNEGGQEGANSRSKTADAAHWSKVWFGKLASFHGIEDAENWQFTTEDVIAFLRSRLKAGVPAWKRVKIVEGLIFYRNTVRRSHQPRLEPIRLKLLEIKHRESLGDGPPSVEGMVGKIDPRESDAIQALRRVLRTIGRLHNTEKAYVKWIRRFMRERGMKRLEEFSAIGEADLEAFLGDLAVDGGVSASSQNQAFYALLFFYEHVLQRKLERIDAKRPSKQVQVPSVMGKSEVLRVFGELSG